MMRLITEYDLKMSKELDKWEEYPDGECHLRRAALVHSVEALKNALLLILWDAYTVVLDRENCLAT